MLPEVTTMPLEFLRPMWLLGLLVLILFSLFKYKKDKGSDQQPIIAPHLSGNIVSKGAHSSKAQLSFSALAAIACIALAGPTWRNIDMPVYEMEKAQVIAFDLTYSMFATDIQPNRLSQAKFKAIDLVKQWSEGEKALIAYAGDAFTITPLTRDGNAIINHIPNLSPDIMPVRGTRADLALDKAIDLLKNAGYNKGHIVFISDGITEQQSQQMIEKLQGTNWLVSILAVATTKGAPIKLPTGTLLKNDNGEIIVPKLNEQPLYDITQASNGLYLTSRTDSSDINQLGRFFDDKQARKSESDQAGSDNFAIDDGYWLSFLLIPLCLLLFRKGLFFALVLAVSVPFSSPPLQAAETTIWKNDQQNGYQAYQNEDYQRASELYDDAFDQGSALYKNKQYEQALEKFDQATQAQPDNASAFYNKGNSYAQLQQLDKAIESYDEALAIDPNLQQAIKNKTLLEQIKKQQEQQQDQDQQNKDEQNSQEQQDKDKSEQYQQDSKQDKQQQQQDQQDSEQDHQQDSQQNDKESKDKSEQDAQKDQDEQQKQKEQQQAEEKQQQQAEPKSESDEQQKDEQQQAQQLEESEQAINEELEQLPNWLKNMPDDPSILLRRKMQSEYRKRSQSKPVKQQPNNGVIW